MTAPDSTTSRLQSGTVVQLNPSAGFGYVRNQSGDHQYIFVFGTAIRRSVAKSLFVGKSVRFRVSGMGRVDELCVAAPLATSS